MGVNADLLFMEQFIIVSSDSNAIVPNIQAMFSSFFANIDIEIHITKERYLVLLLIYKDVTCTQLAFIDPALELILCFYDCVTDVILCGDIS